MATFEDVVKQLQMNNRSEAGRDSRHTKMLSDLKNSIEGLTITTEQSSEPEASRTLPEASKEEKDKEEPAKRTLRVRPAAAKEEAKPKRGPATAMKAMKKAKKAAAPAPTMKAMKAMK